MGVPPTYVEIVRVSKSQRITTENRLKQENMILRKQIDILVRTITSTEKLKEIIAHLEKKRNTNAILATHDVIEEASEDRD